MVPAKSRRVVGPDLCEGKANSCWAAHGQGQAGRWRHLCNVEVGTVKMLRDTGQGTVCTSQELGLG